MPVYTSLFSVMAGVLPTGMAAVVIAFPPQAVHAEPPPAGPSVYRCKAAGVTTFSDRPCGPDARTYEADTAGFSTYKPAPVAPSAARKAKRPRRPKQRAAAAAAAARTRARHDADCARIEKSLRDIRSKMRSGYSAQEGERLRARQAKLRERRRSERCR